MLICRSDEASSECLVDTVCSKQLAMSLMAFVSVSNHMHGQVIPKDHRQWLTLQN